MDPFGHIDLDGLWPRSAITAQRTLIMTLHQQPEKVVQTNYELIIRLRFALSP